MKVVKMESRQVQRLITLNKSIKKLPISRYYEGLDEAKQFLADNKIKTTINPINALQKLASKRKIDCIKSLLEKQEDKWDLYKLSLVTDKDIIHYLGIDKIKNKKSK